MGLVNFLSNSKAFYAYIGLTFFISGLFINMIQAILYLTLYRANINLYRKVNYYLTYMMWSQIVALTDWWSRMKLTVYFADERSKKLICKDHAMYLINHNYELDWLVAWLITERYGILANSKTFAKKSLRWIPIIGWSWFFGEFAFLERSLNKDSSNMTKTLHKFLDYEWPVAFLFCAEGTRFTKDKHNASVEFAKERNLPILKHHLLPRTKGFNMCVQTFKEKNPEMLIAQIQLCFTKESLKPTFMSLFKRKPLGANLYIKMVPLSEISNNSEAETTNYLYELFKEKDDLVDYHNEHNKFPGIEEKVPARIYPLLNWLLWLTLSTNAILYLLYQLIFNASWLLIGILLFVILAGILTMFIMIRSTKIQKGSSYGAKEKQN